MCKDWLGEQLVKWLLINWAKHPLAGRGGGAKSRVLLSKQSFHNYILISLSSWTCQPSNEPSSKVKHVYCLSDSVWWKHLFSSNIATVINCSDITILGPGAQLSTQKKWTVVVRWDDDGKCLESHPVIKSYRTLYCPTLWPRGKYRAGRAAKTIIY